VSETAYQALNPSRVRAPETLRQRLLDEGLLHPDRNEAIAPSPWDRLSPLQIPRGMPVFRLVDAGSYAVRRAPARSN